MAPYVIGIASASLLTFATSYFARLTASDASQILDWVWSDGYTVSFQPYNSDTTPPTFGNDNPLAIQAGQTQTITSSLLSASDNVSSGVDLHYTVTSGPSDGALLLNGSATTSFTQADINNGLVSYHETTSVSSATTDTFFYKVTDAAGNSTGTARPDRYQRAS